MTISNPRPAGDRLNFHGAIMLGAGMFGEPSPTAPANITTAYGNR